MSQVAAEPTHVPCCSAHGVPMTCERYRRTHFVEVRPCCSIDAAALEAVVTRTPLVAALLLQASVVTADDAQAVHLRAKARRAGAVLADLAAAVRERDERVARDVVVWEMEVDAP